jgi:hypothetical protein
LLLRPDGQFEAFGFEATSRYNDLCEDEASEYFYFDRFKMKLYDNKVGALPRVFVLTDMPSYTHHRRPKLIEFQAPMLHTTHNAPVKEYWVLYVTSRDKSLDKRL